MTISMWFKLPDGYDEEPSYRWMLLMGDDQFSSANSESRISMMKYTSTSSVNGAVGFQQLGATCEIRPLGGGH